MARRRYQQGGVFGGGSRRPVWVARWREDFIGTDGKIKRVRRSEVLGTKKDFPTKKLALRELEGRVAPVNRPDYRPLKCETFAVFAEAVAKERAQPAQTVNSMIVFGSQVVILSLYFLSWAISLMNVIDRNSIQSFIQGCQRRSHLRPAATTLPA